MPGLQMNCFYSPLAQPPGPCYAKPTYHNPQTHQKGCPISTDPVQRDPAPPPHTMLAEYLACRRDPAHFVDRYCRLYNATERGWTPFRLWPAQRQVLAALAEERFVLLLKARQLGMSWLCLGYALWLMLFRPAATVLLMSKRDDEAVELLARRLAPMHLRLPGWLQVGRVLRSSSHELLFSNSSRALAVPTTGGRSYTATLALLDEADYLPDLNSALNALKPATDAGGQLVLVSTADKRRPTSPFKQLFRTVYYNRAGAYRALFLPWQARPGRDQAWYDHIAAEMAAQSGGPDDLWQEYPATAEQALAPLQRDKRLPLAWIEACTAEQPPLRGETSDASWLSLPGLAVYALPQPGRRYVIGADPAEGLDAGDEAAAALLDADTGEEAASLAGKLPPGPFAAALAALAAAYHDAGVLVERNNHGHAVLLALAQDGRTRLLAGPEGAQLPLQGAGRPGWLTTARQKALLYDWAAEALRTGATLLHSGVTALQLASIEAATLSAPPGLADDRATAFALALAACRLDTLRGEPSACLAPSDPLAEAQHF